MADSPSRQTIEALPGRLLTFLTGLSKNKAIRAILAGYGYTNARHQQGWDHLHLITGFSHAEATSDIDEEVRSAIIELDAWDEPNFRIAKACLASNHPAQGSFVFQNLRAETGVRSIISVKTFLDRLDSLESGEARASTREADHAALKTLAERGITAAERARLRALVQRTQSADTATPHPGNEPAPPPEPAQPAETGWSATQNEISAYNFFSDWSETARVRLKRRDHLIALGLASRRKKGDDEESEDPTGGATGGGGTGGGGGGTGGGGTGGEGA